MHYRTLVGLAVCASCLWGLVQPVGAAVQYTVTDLTGISGTAYGINNIGQVVGSMTVAGVDRAFVWNNGVLTTLPGIAASVTTAALAINDAGVIVGQSYTASYDKHAVLWNNGVLQDLKNTGGVGLTKASAINSAGQVTVMSNTAGYIWQNGSLTPIGIERPYGINEAGQVVGGKWTGQLYGGYYPIDEPALWDHGTLTRLGSLGTLETYASAINKYGQIVGETVLTVEPGNPYWGRQAFSWEGGVMQPLPVLYDLPSQAYDVNDLGQVVGWMDPSLVLPDRAFFYSAGVLTDLNDLIPLGSGWELGRAYGINDVGQIVGAGYLNGQFRPFLLTPIPEPATVLLLSVCACAYVRRLR
jgi:probable HAF family extracellular repeat protein